MTVRPRRALASAHSRRSARRGSTVFAALTAGAMVVAGCGSSSPSTSAAPTSSPTAAPTSAPSVAASAATPSTAASNPVAQASLPLNGRIAVAEKGSALTLPATWTRIDLGPNGVSELLGAVGSQLPAGLQQTLASQVGQLAATGVSLFAFRTPDGSAVPGTTLNVLVVPSVGIPLDTYESLVVGQLQSQLGTDVKITTSRVTGPAGEFLKLSYALKMGTASVRTLQYLFLAPTKQIVITCGTPGDSAAIEPECESIVKTLEIL